MKITKRLHLAVCSTAIDKHGNVDVTNAYVTSAFNPMYDGLILATRDVDFEFFLPAPGETISEAIASKEAALEKYCEDSTKQMEVMQKEINHLRAVKLCSPTEVVAQ